MSSQWSRLVAKPAGAIPGGLFGQIAVALTTLLIAAFIIAYAIQGGSTEEEPETTAAEPVLAGEGIQRRVDHRIEEQRRLEQLRKAAQARDRLRAQMEQSRPGQQAGPGRPATRTAGMTQGRTPTGGGQPYAGDDALDGTIDAEIAEQELLQELRLQAIRRKHESLRSDPVSLSVRPSPGQHRPPPPRVGSAPRYGPAPRTSPGPETENIRNLLQATENLIELEQQAMTQGTARPGLPAQPALVPAGIPAAAAQDQSPAHTPENPTRVTTPADPEGFERIYEGSFLEGALITQLSGDFPGPALAQVSVPFYSNDRQRVLIPRGTRAIGTAQAVTNRDQTRLAVGFHRLVFPDGRWVSLKFEGLDQVGTTALKDKVNRHYVQMFAAAGAVGILSGLTLQGSNPYAGGLQGFRAGAGQGFGQGATQIMQRFLNRLPTITIRAGHRLRIWFTADVLVPAKADPQAPRF